MSHTQGRLKSDVVAATKGCQQQICEPEWFSPLSSRKNRVEVSESQSRCFVSRMSSVNTQFFCCSICDFRIPYDTKGRGSKYLSKEVQILEDAYIMRDPFADNNLGGIILGADCCLCKRMVCVSQEIRRILVSFPQKPGSMKYEEIENLGTPNQFISKLLNGPSFINSNGKIQSKFVSLFFSFGYKLHVATMQINWKNTNS
nr:unnamed protein product [Fasciola hepatica]